MDVDWGGIHLGRFDSSFIDEELQKRLRKTLYYGKNPLTDRTSLPVTELAVELLQHAAPKELGKIDTQLAASISRKACLSPCSLMLGLIYIDRLRQKSPEYLQQISSADLFIVAMMVASKFLHDDGEDGVYNDEWAESAGIGTETVNELERDFLRAIDWNLLARGKEFEAKMEQLERSVALRKGKERLWKLSYTDLWVFLRNLECLQLFKANVFECLKIFGAVVSAYVLGVFVILVSLSAATTILPTKVESNRDVKRVNLKESAVDKSDLPINEMIPIVQRLGDSQEDEVDVATDPCLPRYPNGRQQQPLCCWRWRQRSTGEHAPRAHPGHYFHNNNNNDLRLRTERRPSPSCNCNEKAIGRNLKIQDNAHNASFAQEKVNNGSWTVASPAAVDAQTTTTTTRKEDTRSVRPSVGVRVFG